MIPTVKIRRDTEWGYAIVNEADFDPETMEIFEESKEISKISPSDPSPEEAPPQAVVTDSGDLPPKQPKRKPLES